MQARLRWKAASFLLPALSMLLGLACDADFAPESAVTGVRLLATQASPAFARPGELVTLATLAVDGRQERARPRPRPLRITYFPTPCVNPAEDEVERCYPALAAPFALGTDASPALTEGDRFSFTLPNDVVSSHAPPRGGPPYGLAFVFVAACAGHLERIDTTGASPGTPPFGCFGEAGERLSANDYVFAFARITASDELRNENPIVEAVTANGAPIDESAGLTVPRCAAAKSEDCPKVRLDVIVPPGSQEPDPLASTPDAPSNESLWVESYVSGGELTFEELVLYDGLTGKSDARNELTAPRSTGDFGLWTVVRDNRGGVAWKSFPLHVQ